MTAATLPKLTPKELAFCRSARISPQAFAENKARKTSGAMTEGQRLEQAAQLAADAVGMTGQSALALLRSGVNPHEVQVKRPMPDFQRHMQSQEAHDAWKHETIHGVAKPPALHSNDAERAAVNSFLRAHPMAWQAPSHQLTAAERELCAAHAIQADVYKRLRDEYRRAHWTPPGLAA